ncbi:hypothetical protein [Candidatus Nitrosocosmicus sp. R]
MNISIPVVLTISLVLLLNTGGSSIYGQIIGQTNQTNQTSGQNTTQQAQQQLDQANQQMQQAQQQKQQAEQQLQQSNQTQQQQQSNQSKQQEPEMNEKLLNYTNAAILALNDDNTSAAQDNLVQIQNALINASGKQVVVVPAPAVSSPSDDDGDSG